MTATKGFFQGLLPSSSCPNQLTNDLSTPAATFDWQFSVSCTVSGGWVCMGWRWWLRMLLHACPAPPQRAHVSCMHASTH
jgi:hypothetical protein